jgi:ankyrin repeat protein
MTSISKLNLDYYRKQAKALLKSARARDAEALARFAKDDPLGDLALHDAQRIIAREQGFASWPKFHAFVEQSKLDARDLVARFVAAATSDGQRARQMLQDHPELKHGGLYAWLVLGGNKGVAAALAKRPDIVNAKIGPEKVEPLVYACFSRFGHARSKRASNLAETVRLLLAAGADPNTSIPSEYGPLSCLYAASGVLGNVEMTRLLLEAGANPNDGESLYHATENPDHACLKLLLAHGADIEKGNAIKHMLDREDPEGLKLLPDAGGDPNLANPQGATGLHWAVMRGRSARIVSMLLDAGADVDAKRADGRTAYAMAMASGQIEIANLLAARGADTGLNAVDAFIAGRGPAPQGLADSPAAAHLMVELVERGNVAGVEALLQAGVSPDVRGGMGETPLHWACWKGNADLIRVLLAHGAPLDAQETTYKATPPGWLHHGSTNCREGDYAEGARLLLAAGVREWTEPSGNDALDGVLREAGLF